MKIINIALLLIYLAIQVYFFSVTRVFGRRLDVRARFLLSIFTSWFFMIAARALTGFIDVNVTGGLAAQREMDSGDAKFLFVVYFGWLMSAIFSFFVWILIGIVKYLFLGREN